MTPPLALARAVLGVVLPRSHAAVAVLAAVLVAASGARAQASDLEVFHEVGFSIAAPTGVVVAVSYAPTLSLLGERLNVGKHDRGQLDSEFFASYWLGVWGAASA